MSSYVLLHLGKARKRFVFIFTCPSASKLYVSMKKNVYTIIVYTGISVEIR